MTLRINTFIIVLLFLLVTPLLAAEDAPPAAQDVLEAAANSDCEDITALLTQQEQRFSRKLRMIKRDIAALNQKLDEPGLAEIVGGIGYIFGLFGIAAFMASRRKNSGAGN